MFRGLFQPLHLFIILIIALIVFGPGKLPQFGAGLSKGLRELKRVLSEGKKIQIPPGTSAQIMKMTKIICKKIYHSFFAKR